MKIFIAVLLLLVATGCSDKSAVPAGIIPPAEMKLVMYDMMRSSEFLSGYVPYKDTSVNKVGESLKWYNKVWQVHKIKEADFRKSYEWYKAHPKIMSELMDSIMVIPTPPNTVPKADSIRPVPVDSIRRPDSGRLKLLRMRQQSKDSIRRKKGLS